MPTEDLGQDQNSTPMPFINRLASEYFRRLFHPVTIIACISCSLLFAFIGPYNTYGSDTLLFRLSFWSSVVVSSCVLSIFFGVWANLRFEQKPFWYHSAIGGIAFSIVYFIFMWNLLNVLFGRDSVPHPAELFAVIVAISALVYVCMWCFTVMLDSRVAALQEPTRTTPKQTIASQNTALPPLTSSRLFAEYRKRLLHPTNLIICLCGALLFAFIGPFGTYQTDTFMSRLLFWSALVFSTSICAMFFGVWANLRFATRPFWFQSTIGGTIFSVIYLFLIWVTLRAIYPPQSTPGHIEFYIATISITSLLYIVMWFFAYMIETQVFAQDLPPKAEATPMGDDAPAETCAVHEFLRRLGPNAGGRLIRLAMSDHYLEAHTDTGMHLLYMRFADAMNALNNANGTQVHRSHWINLNEVKSSAKEGSNVSFIMTDGSSVPVSRSRKKELQERGLI